jgi:glycosyltransferase involved in cell wall biosynthesis
MVENMGNNDENLEAHRFDVNDINASLLNATAAHRNSEIDLDIEDYNNEINMDGNAFLVDTKRNHKDWAKHAKKLLDNPELIKHFGERLYDTVKEKYNQNNVSALRSEYYKQLLNK